MRTQYVIANGPNKFNLIIALFRGKADHDDVDFHGTKEHASIEHAHIFLANKNIMFENLNYSNH